LRIVQETLGSIIWGDLPKKLDCYMLCLWAHYWSLCSTCIVST